MSQSYPFFRSKTAHTKTKKKKKPVGLDYDSISHTCGELARQSVLENPQIEVFCAITRKRVQVVR